MERDSFRTRFEIDPMQVQIGYDSKIIFIGSCFSETIAKRMTYFKFNTLFNPYGIIYNPFSIADEINDALEQKIFGETDIFYRDGIYRNYHFHSRIAHPEKETALQLMNSAVNQLHSYLQTASHLFMTFGTSLVYKLKENEKMVANNHKQPADLFYKSQAKADEIISVWTEIVNKLKKINPSLNIIFTVSPVRYMRSGIVADSRSKAELLVAVHALKEQFPEIFYFPSFELMRDDLRDYRFYGRDMAHPNETATDYIFSQFKSACINENCSDLMRSIDDIETAKEHRPFFPGAEQHKQFLKEYLLKVQELQKQFTALNFTEEINYFSGN